MPKKKVRAAIDINEASQCPDIQEALDNHDDVEDWELRNMDSADININGIGFERKTPSDYASSLQKGRLESQVARMKEQYEFAYILIDGDMRDVNNLYGGMPAKSIKGSQASLTARENSGVVGVFYCSNNTELVDWAVRLTRKHLEKSGKSKFEVMPAVNPDLPTTLQMYCCIDGIGTKTAKALHENYPSIHSLVKNGDIEELQKIDGIGEKTAINIVQSLL